MSSSYVASLEKVAPSPVREPRLPYGRARKRRWCYAGAHWSLLVTRVKPSGPVFILNFRIKIRIGRIVLKEYYIVKYNLILN